MPELPEVETIASYLRNGRLEAPTLLNCTIEGSKLLWGKTLELPRAHKFYKTIKGQKILAIRRRGKFLVFDLSEDFLLIHLRMSGDISVESNRNPVSNHCRLILFLDNGFRISFNDPRKFGRVWLTTETDPILAKLGPEPFDTTLTPDVFHQRLQAHQRQIKPLLLDQSFLAGMGNIYTDEALNKAKIHPLSQSSSISRVEAKRLLTSIRQVLTEGIQRQGASIDWVYRGGDFQNYFRVYKRTGLPCPECGTSIRRFWVGQRGTHYCPTCQPDPD